MENDKLRTEKVRLRSAQYRQENKEHIRQYRKQYAQEHKEEIRQQKKIYTQEHKEHIKTYRDQYNKTHKEMINQKHREYRKTPSGRMATYMATAKAGNKIFTLSIEKFTELTSQSCAYCGGKSENRDYCGIDRVDSKIGYIEENCVPCCDFCNYSKQDLPRDQFISHIIKILTYQGYNVEKKDNQEFANGAGI